MRHRVIITVLVLLVITGNFLIANEDFSNKVFSKYIVSKDRNVAQYVSSSDGELDIEYYEFDDRQLVINEFNNYYNEKDDLIYSIGMYFIERFTYNVENTYPGTTWDKKSGNCTGLTQIYKELLREYNVDYYVLTGYLDGVYHMLVTIKQDDKWYLSDMSLTVSNGDVGYMKTGYYDVYKFDYVPVDLQPYREWYLGDKNLYVNGKLYSTEFNMLWLYNNGLRIQQEDSVSDIIVIDNELYYKGEGDEYVKVR